MVERHSNSDAASEQQDPGRSPIEDEFRQDRPGTPTERENITILGLGMSVALGILFVVFLLAGAAVVFLT